MPRAAEKGDILDLVVVNKKAAELSFGTTRTTVRDRRQVHAGRPVQNH